ncbi:methanogenesis imperfect marker protein 11 [Methanolinea mesophila]|uniref:tRNA(Ile2) 2-agmatinylcytidine synthetase n=1 Tax=Methanolinea mesophila TaxID=547055 RepID=UPI00315813AA|nr:methanogenesis imperfect marker protein 11 [Methanolinea mesophila]
MVDERAGVAEIIEQCSARGPVEWDAANRLRAGGATQSCRVEGSTLTLRAKLGSYPVRFGAASKDIGGQALEGVGVEGDQVITSWAGIAGAGVGVAACLPQAPGVVRAEYPDEEDLSVGGARANRVRIVSPLYEKVTIGIDDTDTKEKGATWVTALNCGKECRIPGVEFLDMRLVQLNPEAPKKTTNCVSSALNFAVRPGAVEELLSCVKEYVEARTFSGDTGIAVYRGIEVPETDFARRVKTDLLSLADAEEEARRLGIRFIDDFQRKGRIGAIGAVLWANRGIEAAGLYGETF